MPKAEHLAYVIAACGAILGTTAVVALFWKGVKKFFRLTDMIDASREFLIEAVGQPETREHPGVPGLMDEVRTIKAEQRAQRETLDSLVEWRARQGSPTANGRRRRPGL